MKSKILISIAITLAGGVGIALSIGGQPAPVENPMTMANVEALTNFEEVVIVCDGGKDGRCFKEDSKVQLLCNGAYYHPCIFTGYQTDECYQPCGL